MSNKSATERINRRIAKITKILRNMDENQGTLLLVPGGIDHYALRRVLTMEIERLNKSE